MLMQLFPRKDQCVVAAVCRNDQGVFVAASATACRLADTETLEAMVCVEALALAEDWDSTGESRFALLMCYQEY